MRDHQLQLQINKFDNFIKLRIGSANRVHMIANRARESIHMC